MGSYIGCGTESFSLIIIVMAMIFVWAVTMAILFGTTKSKRYRKLLADLYVAGKIKIIAKKDGIALADEMKDFRSAIKKWKMETQPLDDTIESELQEKIEEDSKDTKGIDLK